MMYLGVNMGTLAHLHSTLQSFAMTMARVNGDVKLSLHGEQFNCSPALGVSNSQERGVKMSNRKLFLLRILFLVLLFVVGSGIFEALFIMFMERMGF